jgi:hypothetical protein
VKPRPTDFDLSVEDQTHRVKMFRADMHPRSPLHPNPEGTYFVTVCECGFGCIGTSERSATEMLRESYQHSPVASDEPQHAHQFATDTPTVEFPDFASLDHIYEAANTGHA